MSVQAGVGSTAAIGSSSEPELLSLSVVAWRTFCMAVTGVSWLADPRELKEEERERDYDWQCLV